MLFQLKHNTKTKHFQVSPIICETDLNIPLDPSLIISETKHTRIYKYMMFDDEALYGPVNSYAARTERVQFPMYFSRMSLVLTFGYAICEMGSKGSVPDVLQQNVISVDIWLCNL